MREREREREVKFRNLLAPSGQPALASVAINLANKSFSRID